MFNLGLDLLLSTSVNLVHNAPVELPPAQSFPARAPHLARAPPPPPRAGPPRSVLHGLSFPPPPKTLHREREPMGLHQRGNESEMTSEKKK